MVKTTGIEILQRLRPCKIRQAHNILMLALLEKNLGLTYASKYPSYCIKNENMTIRIWIKYVFGRFSGKRSSMRIELRFSELKHTATADY